MYISEEKKKKVCTSNIVGDCRLYQQSSPCVFYSSRNVNKKRTLSCEYDCPMRGHYS